MFLKQWECMKLHYNTAEVGDSMANINFTVDDAELKKVYNALQKHKDAAQRALIRTVNDTAQRTLTPLKDNITKNYNIKKMDLSGGSKYKGEKSNNLIKVKKISSLRMNASIDVRGGYLTLQRFVKGKKTPSNKKGNRVTVQVKKGKSIKLNNRSFIQNARGSLQVFNRHSGSRDIWRLLKTVSVAHMASNENVAPKVQESALEIMRKRSEHYINQELKKLKG